MTSQWNWAIRNVKFRQLIKQGVDPEEAKRLALEYMKKVDGDEEE